LPILLDKLVWYTIKRRNVSFLQLKLTTIFVPKKIILKMMEYLEGGGGEVSGCGVGRSRGGGDSLNNLKILDII